MACLTLCLCILTLLKLCLGMPWVVNMLPFQVRTTSQPWQTLATDVPMPRTQDSTFITTRAELMTRVDAATSISILSVISLQGSNVGRHGVPS